MFERTKRIAFRFFSFSAKLEPRTFKPTPAKMFRLHNTVLTRENLRYTSRNATKSESPLNVTEWNITRESPSNVTKHGALEVVV